MLYSPTGGHTIIIDTSMPKTTYVDGYVLVVPKEKVDAYRTMAQEAGESWMKHGALSFRECMIDDATPDMGEFTLLRFGQLIPTGPDDTIWFSYIEFESKEHRDEVNKKVHAEMEAYQQEHPDHMDDMPFDMTRMAYGGFTVEASNK